MKHLVYKTTNLVNGKYYIGVHSCNCTGTCSYLGSGEALKAAIKKYGRQNFSRKTLRTFQDKQDAYSYEADIVEPNDPKSYNLRAGGFGYHPIECSYTVDGQVFENLQQAAKKLGLSISGVAYRKRNPNRLCRSKQNKLNRSKPCSVKGKSFSSQNEAAKFFGVSPATISSWLKAPS